MASIKPPGTADHAGGTGVPRPSSTPHVSQSLCISISVLSIKSFVTDQQMREKSSLHGTHVQVGAHWGLSWGPPPSPGRGGSQAGECWVLLSPCPALPHLDTVSPSVAENSHPQSQAHSEPRARLAACPAELSAHPAGGLQHLGSWHLGSCCSSFQSHRCRPPLPRQAEGPGPSLQSRTSHFPWKPEESRRTSAQTPPRHGGLWKSTTQAAPRHGSSVWSRARLSASRRHRFLRTILASLSEGAPEL